jgi:hypothetical protein
LSPARRRFRRGGDFILACVRTGGERRCDGTIYANTMKTVKYVGSEECAFSRHGIYQTYLQSDVKIKIICNFDM